jgi:plasmid replication initiation protein
MSKLIRQDNIITKARYDFTACQLDILFSMMGQIHDEDSTNKVYTMYAKEIEDLTGRKWDYSQFREATENMGSRMFEIKTEKDYTQFWLFQRVKYIVGQGRVEIKFSEDAINLLKQLKNNFTTYELQSALSMSSKYAKRIYQICSQWKDIGESKRFEIKELKSNLGLIDNKGYEEYAPISMFKSRVLDIAIKQINEHTDLEISYHLAGDHGRKKPLKTIVFYIKKKSPLILPIEFEKEKNPNIRMQQLYLVLDKFGIKSSAIIKQIIENEEMIKVVFLFNYQHQTGVIKAENPAGLLLTKLGLTKPKANK